MKRYIVERPNKAELRPEEQSEKADSCRENLWNEIQLNEPLRHKQTGRWVNGQKESGWVDR